MPHLCSTSCLSFGSALGLHGKECARVGQGCDHTHTHHVPPFCIRAVLPPPATSLHACMRVHVLPVPAVSHNCMVTWASPTRISFTRKSQPMVACREHSTREPSLQGTANSAGAGVRGCGKLRDYSAKNRTLGQTQSNRPKPPPHPPAHPPCKSQQISCSQTAPATPGICGEEGWGQRANGAHRRLHHDARFDHNTLTT
jgi:hypothetical protein